MVAGMPEHGSLTGLDSSKSFKKWRGKLFSHDKDSRKAARDTQVDDFLASSRPSPAPVNNNSNNNVTSHHAHSLSHSQSVSHAHAHASADAFDAFSQPRAVPKSSASHAPRIDVSFSRQWPDQNSLSSSASPTLLRDPDFPESSRHRSPPSPAAAVPVGSNLAKKRPRKRGLRVIFCNKTPDIIGEGGDESEVPTKDMISRYRTRAKASAPVYSGAGPDSFAAPSTLKRSLTGYTPPSLAIQRSNASDTTADQPWKPPLMQNAQDSDFLLSIAPDSKASRLSLREDDDPNSLARRVQRQMRAEEGKAFQNRKDDVINTSVEHESESDEPRSPASQSSVNNMPGLEQTQSANSSTGLSFWSSVLASLPEQNKDDNGSRQENQPVEPLPSSPPATALPRQTPPPPYVKTRAPEAPNHSREESRSSLRGHQSQDSRDSSTSKPTLRSLANVVNDSAVAGFTAYVAQYENVFSMAAENMKPTRETSLSEWVRASAWWFLSGRSELESAMRSARSSSGGGAPQSPSTNQLQQAAVNLAKSWWINQRIIPQHPDLHRFGNVSTDVMVTLSRTAGDRRTAELLGHHQGVISNLRALSMSMKRNNILPSEHSAQAAIAQGVDTTIWLKYPFFSPDVSTVLSGMVSRSMLVENNAKIPNISEIMPTKDTETHFSYARMFVEVFVSSGEDDSQQYAIPCMISITRDRTAWDVIATITSQSELVNIVIQSDRKQGPTWADVSWHVRTCGMSVRLPRGFELDINFSQPDFKMIWKVVEYTRKVEESLEPEPGEKFIFEDILPVFQYFDKTSSGAFPPEPSPRCRVRLFERTVQITEGTGSREAHRGFRFVAVTSPKVKTLSSVCHHLGCGSPVLFGYLRGDNGAPALMLKVEEKGASFSMLLTFHDPEQRSRMHSLLMGVTPTIDEVKFVKDLQLRSYSMEPVGHQANGSPQGAAPIQFSASSATVINTHPDQEAPLIVLSPYLRVFVNSNWGSVTDRINLGK